MLLSASSQSIYFLKNTKKPTQEEEQQWGNVYAQGSLPRLFRSS
jgi:hypothetical protein